ncbi:MAG: LPXTG cell wall anchor domain-containing protein, partial [Thermomicrobiales bacterium]
SDACCSDSGNKDEHKPEVGGGSVVIDTLPNTGTGTSLEGASMVGAAALLAGAVAAAGTKLRRTGKHPHRA